MVSSPAQPASAAATTPTTATAATVVVEMSVRIVMVFPCLLTNTTESLKTSNFFRSLAIYFFATAYEVGASGLGFNLPPLLTEARSVPGRLLNFTRKLIIHQLKLVWILVSKKSVENSVGNVENLIVSPIFLFFNRLRRTGGALVVRVCLHLDLLVRKTHLTLNPVHHLLVLDDAAVEKNVKHLCLRVIGDSTSGYLIVLKVWNQMGTTKLFPKVEVVMGLHLHVPVVVGFPQRGSINPRLAVDDKNDANLRLPGDFSGGFLFLPRWCISAFKSFAVNFIGTRPLCLVYEKRESFSHCF